MAAPSFVAAILERIGPLLSKVLPAPKKGRGPAEEPFHELEDHSPEPDESYVPNAFSSRKPAASPPKLDLGSVAKDLLSKPAVVATIGVVGIFCVALIVVAFIVNQQPPVSASSAGLATPEGRAEAARLLLPPDPARDLSPPMERSPRFPYTDEDVRRLAPAHGPDELAPIVERNDKAMETLFGAVP